MVECNKIIFSKIRNSLFLIFVFNPIFIFSQKKYNKPIETSIFHSLSLSYSKLYVKKDGFSSPPRFNAGGIGIKMQRLLTLKQPKVFLTTHIGGMSLSTSGQFQFYVPKDSAQVSQISGMRSRKTFINRYTAYSLGLKKSSNTKRNFNLNIELGVRLLVEVNLNRDNEFYDIYPFNYEIVKRNIIFEKSRKFTMLPYISSGFECKIGKFKFGFQIWIQNSFIEMTRFDYKVKRDNILFYDSKMRSTGLAWGNNTYVVLKTF